MNTCKLASLLLLSAALVKAHAQPVITRQPTNQSLSLGASAKFQISAAVFSAPRQIWTCSIRTWATGVSPNLPMQWSPVQRLPAGNAVHEDDVRRLDVAVN